MFNAFLDPVSMALDRIRECDLDEDLKKPIPVNQPLGPIDYDTTPWAPVDYKTRVKAITDVHCNFDPMAENSETWSLSSMVEMIKQERFQPRSPIMMALRAAASSLSRSASTARRPRSCFPKYR